ncbi:InlB B-repeat-containing protein [Rariglobus hedericola]|uniref:InlB B-repeat-containing protein n=1 Tax=Rariglobus hedericola TaxID=2597822 RepID=UPI0013967E81|nr:polysaccharide deacetylase family protein [Rariglobus hedericola]
MTAAFSASAHAAIGDSQVARWKDNKTACFLLMFDDSCPSHFQVAIPEMVKRGMIGTFYVNPGGSGYTSNAAQWNTVIPQLGMVYGNHTWSHANTTTLVGMEDEIRKCWEVIRNIYYPGDTSPHLISYGQPGVNTWFSYGQPLTDILNNYNMISRPEFIAGKAPFTGINTLPELLAVADTAITQKGMGYTIFHGLQRRPSEGDPDQGGQDFWAFDKDVYRRFLDGLKTRRDGGDLWITDPISYHKYEKERNSATITVTAATSSLVTLTLTTTTNALYDLPLTVNTQVPSAWRAATVVQGAKTVSVPVSNGSIRYDALPNGGTVSITESALPVVTIKATSPEAYETGAAPGVFTVSTSGTQPVSVNYLLTGTAANGTRFNIAASPLAIASSSATLNATPVTNSVYEGEQSVVITLAPGSDYIIGSDSSATVMIHDRTDIAPADWYLQANQPSGQHWNNLPVWKSQPTGGTQLSAFSRGTVNDRFHTNGFELRTKNAYYPPDQSFYGNNIVLDGPAAKLSLALTAYYGSSGMPTNTVPTLTTNGGSINPFVSTLTQLLTVGTFNSLGTTRVLNGGNISTPTGGLNLRVTKLTGPGELTLTNGPGTGTFGSLLFNVSNATHYRGKLNLAGGTLSFPINVTSCGPLALATGTAVINSKAVKVARLTIGKTILPAGTYTTDDLNGRGVTFTGTGTITTSLIPDGWSHLDIGAPALSGAATYSGSTWTLTGSGTQIGATSDKFAFTSAQTTTATPSIVARITSVQTTPVSAQAGVMLRDGTDANAPFVALTVSPAGLITLRSRTVVGATATAVQASATVAAPVWLKLNQASGTITAAYSTNNISWTPVGSVAANFAGAPQAGLAICAGTDTVRATATVTDVSVENTTPVLTASTLSVSASPTGAGTIAGSGIFENGTAISLNATPSAGYGFAGWRENSASVTTASVYNFTLNESRSLVAHFQPANLATFQTTFFTTTELNDAAISAPSADPDGDGYSNLLEYALGTNPKVANSLHQQSAFENGQLALIYQRSKTASDLAYIVEVSNDLKTWKFSASDVSAATVLDDDGYTQTIRVRDLTPPSSIDPRFIRLRIVTQ